MSVYNVGDTLVSSRHLTVLSVEAAPKYNPPVFGANEVMRTVDPHGKEWMVYIRGSRILGCLEKDSSVEEKVVTMWALFSDGTSLQPVGCEMPAGPKHKLTPDHDVYIMTTPNSHQIVVEATTGAIIAESLEDAVAGALTTPVDTIQKHIEAAREKLPNLKVVSPRQFWSMYEMEEEE